MSKSSSDAESASSIRKASILSPLRYPGGKRRLVSYVAETICLNGLHPKLFVEPFAGGASVSLQLLQDGLVERIALGEKDPLVASFWRTVFTEPEWLISEIQKVEVSLDKWDWFRAYRPRVDRTRALKCLFLNRTSFSGILSSTAGPIGGRGQESQYGIGCRFTKSTIIKRIRQAARLADRVAFVQTGDWTETVRRVEEELDAGGEDVLYYLDPPFYEKADRLYRYFFKDGDHRRLRDGLENLDGRFILSYDAAEPVARLYRENGHGFEHVEMLYSATKPDRLVEAEELVVTDLAETPSATRLWQSSGEWSDGTAG